MDFASRKRVLKETLTEVGEMLTGIGAEFITEGINTGNAEFRKFGVSLVYVGSMTAKYSGIMALVLSFYAEDAAGEGRRGHEF